MARVRLVDDTVVQVARMISIAVLVIVGLIVLAVRPDIQQSVIPTVSVGVTAIASVRRTDQQLASAPVAQNAAR